MLSLKRICTGLLLSFCSASLLCAEMKKFDWSQVLNVPPGAALSEGNQVLHFKPTNKPYDTNPEAVEFVKKYCKNAKALNSDADVLRFASDSVTLDGAFIELGVCTGKTVNFIAALNPYKRIYGFDSFHGLPEDWVRNDKVFKKGTFAYKNPQVLPPVLHNVELIVGLFEATLPDFQKTTLKDQQIAFLHFDSDIYSSAKAAFRILGSNIGEGTIILFDELYNYPGYDRHEWKALCEFLQEHNFEAEVLAYNEYHEQVALRIKNKISN